MAGDGIEAARIRGEDTGRVPSSSALHEPGAPAKRTLLEGSVAPERSSAEVLQKKNASSGETERAGDWLMDEHLSAALGLGERSGSAEHAMAARGLETPATTLPHLAQIQASFGSRHDVSGVQAHVGGAAAEASSAMGARAYAIGDHVAFAQAPDLHTAAHEAAHVVQQRAGVHLKAGVGAPGDPYEQHADEVADAVVRGAPAGALLDQMAPAGARGGAAAVQHEKGDPPGGARTKERAKGGGKQGGKKASPAEELSLPEGVNHRLLGTSGTQVVRTSWFMEGATEEDGKVSNPPKMEELNRELKRVFWWMTEEQIAESRRFYFSGRPQLEFFRAFNASNTFGVYGLPPGTDIVWRHESDESLSLILSLRVVGLEQPPDLPRTFKVSDELRNRIDASFERTFGVLPQFSMLSEDELKAAPKNWAWVIPYSKDRVTDRVGPAWAQARKIKPADPTTDDTSAFGGMVFPNSIPVEDRQYFVAWMEKALGKQAPTGGAGSVEIDAELIRAMKALDGNAVLKEKVLDRLRAGAAGATFALDSRTFRRIVHETTEAEERARLGLAAPVAPQPEPSNQQAQKPYLSPHDVEVAPKTRTFERPITGKIVNHGSLASVGKAMDLQFVTEDPQGLGFVAVRIDWYATPMGAPTDRVREGHTFHFAHHAPEKWSVSFDKVGKYEITAFVDHQSYWPTSFKTFLEIKTEDERLRQVEEHAFGAFDDETQVSENQHFFDVSFTNDRLGPNKYTFGKVREGKLPADWDSQTLEQRLGFMARDRDSLNALIAQHKNSETRASKDLVAYAQHALETMKSTEGRIQGDAKDLSHFEVRGAFLSEQNGVRSGDLNLIGLAGSRRKSMRLDGDEIMPSQTVEWDQPTVRLHDLSQLYEPKNAVFTGEGDTFRASAEKAFIELCKSYPAGRVSVVMEQLTEGGARTGKTLGFELHTGTAWKDAKEVIWDSRVQLAVNLVAAAATIFIPGAALVTMALVTAYNAVDTLDSVAALERKGQATWKDGVEAGVMIGVDLLPFLGELKAVGKLGKSTLFAIDAAQVATNVVVLTDQGLSQVRALRDQQVTEIARLQQELEDLRAVNDSDPRIAAKERELNERIVEARGAATKIFTDMAASGLVMLAAPLAFTHMLRGFSKGAGGDLASSDLFAEGKKGEVPHYDPDTGKIHGDSTLLTPELTARLQEAWTMDVYAKHADAANLLGVRTEEVVLRREAKAKKTSIKKNEQGIWEITAPEKSRFSDVLDEIWQERQKLPGAPGERPRALERGSYEPTFSTDEIIKVGRPVVVGNRIESRGAADEIMQALADGDRKALQELGVAALPKGFDPRSVEWGLGVLPDGKYVVIRGDQGAVDWAPFPEVRSLAHTHPLRQGKMLRPDGGAVGIDILDMVKGHGVNHANQMHFLPSAADVAFCVRNAFATHQVRTPYVHIGGGKIGNPVGDFADLPRISIEITGSRRVGSWFGIDEIPAYQAHLVVKDSNGKLLWEGEMYAIHHPSSGSMVQCEPFPASWLKPHLAGAHPPGGTTPAPTRAPRNEVEELALADWQKLTTSGKDFTTKFDSDIWYDRYNDGLRYDIDGNHWVRPDGRKPRDPQKFDNRSWTSKKVYEHLTGKDSTSTFKQFAEMLIDKKLATPEQIQKKIEEVGFLGRDEDQVRHELKAAYHDTVLAAMTSPATPEAKFKAMRDITERLDSADKGNLTEDWYREVHLGGKGDTHVAARRDALLENQGIELEKNRFVDIVDGNVAREIKSGEGALGAADMSQMRDYAQMVDGRAIIRGPSGSAEIRHARYTFTSPMGARANAEMMRTVFTGSKLEGRVTFEVFKPNGERVVIRDIKGLEAQRWLFE